MNRNNQNLETILYKIVGELSKLDAPIIFKGGLALKDLLYLSNPNIQVERKTVDIDANWIDEYNQNKIETVLSKAVKKVNVNYEILLYRNAGENKSMGFKVVDEFNQIVTKIDLDIKDNPFYIICNINDVDIKYSSFEKIMADKLCTLSSEYVFRRIKDLLDVYLIISGNEIDMNKVGEILDYDNRRLGNFTTLLSNKEKIKDSYNKLTGIDNKPEFEKVWNKVVSYLDENELI